MNRRYSKELPSHRTKLHMASECQPRVKAGKAFSIDVTQKAPGFIESKDDAATSSQVNFFVEGPHERLAQLDVVGRYPGPGSTTTPDEYLPHIALMRRTLPWERDGVQVGKPWMVLLTVAASEIRTPGKQPIETRTLKSLKDVKTDEADAAFDKLKDVAGFNPDTSLDFVWLEDNLLKKILPLKSEIPLLCHLQRLEFDADVSLEDLDSMWKLDDDCDVAVVVGNRLPWAGNDPAKEPEKHFAFLVSVENRTDLDGLWPSAHDADDWEPPAAPGGSTPTLHPMAAPGASTSAGPTATIPSGLGHGVVAVAMKKRPLVVLSYWSFTPSKGKDFEEVVKAIAIRPNGGVLRFGKLPYAKGAIPTLTADGFLLLDGPGKAQLRYRGPLSPVPLGHSHKIALRAEPEELQGEQVHYSYAAAFELGRLLALADDGVLEDMQGVRSGLVFPKVVVDILAVDKVPAAIAKKDWGVNPPPTDIQNPTGDPTGIAKVFTAQQKQQIIAELTKGAANEPGGVLIDIEDATVAELEHMFPRVLTNGRS